VVVFHPPRVLEKRYTRPDENNKVVFVLFGGHHALVQENGDFGEHMDVDIRGLSARAAVLPQNIEDARVVSRKALQRQNSLHFPASIAVA